MRKFLARRQNGLSIVEMVVATAILTLVVTSAMGAFQLYLKLHNRSIIQARAMMLLEEGTEALRFLRDISWTANIATLSNGTDYYIFWNGSQYATSTTPISASDNLLIKITPSAINRDTTTWNIVESGGNPDSGSKKIRITIAPITNPGNEIISTYALIHDIFKN